MVRQVLDGSMTTMSLIPADPLSFNCVASTPTILCARTNFTFSLILLLTIASTCKIYTDQTLSVIHLAAPCYAPIRINSLSIANWYSMAAGKEQLNRKGESWPNQNFLILFGQISNPFSRLGTGLQLTSLQRFI